MCCGDLDLLLQLQTANDDPLRTHVSCIGKMDWKTLFLFLTVCVRLQLLLIFYINFI